jgi:hypothetical protein
MELPENTESDTCRRGAGDNNASARGFRARRLAICGTRLDPGLRPSGPIRSTQARSPHVPICGAAQRLANLLAIARRSFRFVLGMPSNNLTNLLAGFESPDCSGILGTAGRPSPWNKS